MLGTEHRTRGWGAPEVGFFCAAAFREAAAPPRDPAGAEGSARRCHSSWPGQRTDLPATCQRPQVPGIVASRSCFTQVRRTGFLGGVERSNELPHEGQSPPRPPFVSGLPTWGWGVRFKNQLKSYPDMHTESISRFTASV